MTGITILDRSGVAHDLPLEPGRSLMEVIRDGGIDEMLALCGGCLSCATCHVLIDPDMAGRLARLTADESDLLDSSDHRTVHSRLACQIILESAMAGLRATIAPDD